MTTLKEVQEMLPKEALISKAMFEAADIVFYTKSKEFFINSSDAIKPLVKELKKRIEVRPDPSISLEESLAKEKIMEIVPKDADVKQIIFEPEFGKVMIYARKPGLVIGKYGSTLRTIKEKTLWSPDTKRIPLIKSDIVNKAREIVHEEAAYRKKFLNKIGEKIQMKKGSKEGWVRLSFLGGANEVGRSCMLLETKESNVMLDCGVSYSSSNQHPYLDSPDFDVEDLDAIVISHAHMDHVGFLPYLYEYGYEGPVYLTKPTRDIMILQQLDYVKISQNETGNSLYTSKGIKNAIKHSISIGYGEVCDITSDMRLTFQDAGHIIGSAISHFHIGDGLFNLIYTGDLRFRKSHLLDPASTNFQRVEALLMESTYGGPQDVIPQMQEAEDALMEIINRTIARGGKLLIPSFAVGRAQEIMVMLASHADRGEINFPVYVDGMIWDATAIHTTYPEFLSRNLQNQIFHHGNNPFAKEIFRSVGSPREREQVINGEPAVIISTSGMMNGGPILEYLRSLGEDEKNTLSFVGYNAEGTLGRQIEKGWKDIPISPKEGDRREMLRLGLEIEKVSGFGGHSDRAQLLNYIRHLKDRPSKIILNHGEPNKVMNLARMAHTSFKAETFTPKNLEAMRLV